MKAAVEEGHRMQHKLQFLPRYSPQLNPIELMFNQWKQYVKLRLNEASERIGLLSLIEEAANTITPSHCLHYYENVNRYYSDCLQGKELKALPHLPVSVNKPFRTASLPR